jgi:hypothetical protein
MRSMRATEKVFIVFFSQSDTRPFIRTDANEHVDWIALAEWMEGTRPSESYEPIELTVDHPDGTQFDFYRCDGRHDVFSERAVRILGFAAFKNYRLFPARINGAPYFILSRCLTEIDCFDRQNSTYVECDPPEKLMFSIAEYAFFPERIDPACFFSIPESQYLFCTQVLAEVIDRELKGFGLIEVFDVSAGTSVDRRKQGN